MKRILTAAVFGIALALGLQAAEVIKLTPEYEKFLETRPRPNITIEAKKKLNAYYKELDVARKALAREGEFGGDYAYIVSAADLKPSYNSRSKNVENFTRGRYYFVNSGRFSMNLFEEDSEHPLLLVSEEDVVEIESNRHLVFTLTEERTDKKQTFRSSVFRKTEQYEKALKSRKKSKNKKSRR